MIAIWRRLLGRTDIHVDADWFDDLPQVQKAPLLIQEVRQASGVELSDGQLFRDSKLRDLAATVDGRSAPLANPHVVPLRAGQRPPVLVYVPSARGDDIHARHQLGRLGHPVCFLRAPGLEAGEHPASSVAELASFYYDCVYEALAGEDVVFAGHSLGAMVAVEMAIIGAQRGWRPLAVILVDMGEPVAEFEGFSVTELMMLRLQAIISEASATTSAIAPKCPIAEPSAEQVGEIVSYLHYHNSPDLPAGVPWPHLERRLRVFATGMLAAAAYHVRPCDLPVLAIRGKGARASGLTWAEVTRYGQPEIVDFDADHVSFWDGPEILAPLEQLLETAATEYRSRERT